MPPRNRIVLEQRQRIIQAFEDVSEDYLTVAATIGVNRSTARSIFARYLREGRIAERPRGGANHVRVDDEMRNCLNDIINENCQLTLAQINQELRQRLLRKPAIHNRTVARTLEGMLYRVKLARLLAADRNRPDVLQKRVDYANCFMRHAVVNHSIFVDECGYNIWTARSHGRARLGERAYRQVCGQRGRNITVALTISPTNGLGPNSELKKPPYSPFLNIVEQAISVLKADISRPEQQEQMNNREEARRQGIALGNFRTQLLLQTPQRNIGTSTAAKCGQWYRLMQTYIPRCLNSEEIEG